RARSPPRAARRCGGGLGTALVQQATGDRQPATGNRRCPVARCRLPVACCLFVLALRCARDAGLSRQAVTRRPRVAVPRPSFRLDEACVLSDNVSTDVRKGAFVKNGSSIAIALSVVCSLSVGVLGCGGGGSG